MGMSTDLGNQHIEQAARAKLQMMNFVPQGANQAPTNGPVDLNRMNQLERQSQMKIPGAPSEADLGNMTKEASTLDEVSKLHKQFNDAYDMLNNKALAGQLNPADRDAVVKSLSGKLAKVAEGRYSQSAGGMAESMLPGWKDFGTTRADKSKMNDEFFNILGAGTPTLARFGALKKDDTLTRQQPQAQQQAAPQYKIGVDGKKYMRGPNGQAVPVQ
jgi:hypothetical protein